MKFKLESGPAAKVEAQALITYVFEPEIEQLKSSKAALAGSLAEIDQVAGGAIAKLAANGEMTGKMLEMTLLHFLPGVSQLNDCCWWARVKRGKFRLRQLRKMAASAIRYLEIALRKAPRLPGPRTRGQRRRR